jgi:hypothetical protein
MRLIIATLLAFLLVACKSKEEAASIEPARMRSSIEMRDPRTAGQLVSGFHSIENNAWRWTERQFAVTLALPRPAQNGAVLALKFTIPAAVIQALQTVTLSALIENSQLAPESYSEPGAHVYQRDLDAGQLAGDSIRVSFRLDKALAPSGSDLRELGIIAQSVSLTAK